jgi:hypothetical protein
MATYATAPTNLTAALRHVVGIWNLELDFPDFDQERFDDECHVLYAANWDFENDCPYYG